MPILRDKTGEKCKSAFPTPEPKQKVISIQIYIYFFRRGELMLMRGGPLTNCFPLEYTYPGVTAGGMTRMTNSLAWCSASAK